MNMMKTPHLDRLANTGTLFNRVGTSRHAAAAHIFWCNTISTVHQADAAQERGRKATVDILQTNPITFCFYPQHWYPIVLHTC